MYKQIVSGFFLLLIFLIRFLGGFSFCLALGGSIFYVVFVYIVYFFFCIYLHGRFAGHLRFSILYACWFYIGWLGVYP